MNNQKRKLYFYVPLITVTLLMVILTFNFPVKAATNLIAEYNDEAIYKVGNGYRDKQGNYILAVGETATYTATQTVYSSVSAIDWQIDKGSVLSLVGRTPDVNSCQTTVTVRGVRPGTATLNGRVLSSYSIGMVYDVQWCDNPFPIRVVEPVSQINLSKSSASLAEGESLKIEVVSVAPDSLYSLFVSSPMTWSSSDTSVVTVDSGTITAVGRGTAVVTISTKNGVSASCTVSVTGNDSGRGNDNSNNTNSTNNTGNTNNTKRIKPKSIKLSKKKITLTVGRSKELKATVYPEKAVTKITLKSSNPKVASVNKSGKIKAKKTGRAVITASTGNGKKAKCKVTVIALKAKKIKPDNAALIMKEGTKQKLKYTILPDGAKTRVYFISSRPKVAAVSKKGVIKAKKAGKATITIITANGKKAKCKVTVKALNSNKKSSQISEDIQKKPSGISDNKKVEADNSTDASVSRPAESVNIIDGSPYIMAGESMSLRAEVTPSDTTDTISWFSSDNSVATVTSGGLVKAVGDGGVTITAKAGNKSTSIQIAVVSGDVYDISKGELLILADNLFNNSVKYCGDEYEYNTSKGVTIVQSDPNKSNMIRIGGGKVTFANVHMSGEYVSVFNYSRPGDIIIEFMEGTENYFSAQNAPIDVHMVSDDDNAPGRLIIQGGGKAELYSGYGPALYGNNITIRDVAITAHVVTSDCAVIGTYANTDCSNITVESGANITVYGGYTAVGAGLGGAETNISVAAGTIAYGLS